MTYDSQMKASRYNVSAIAIFLIAAFAVLFVTTAAVAQPQPAAPVCMEMSGINVHEHSKCDMNAMGCASHCAVLCQALIVESPTIQSAVYSGKNRLSWTHSALGSVVSEADDPPPR